MRLTILRSELEAGFSVQGGTKERIITLKHLAERRDPVAITPVTTHDQRVVAVVRLTEDAMDNTGRGTSLDIKFRPVWCRTYTLCSMTKDTLIALTMEFEFGKYWISKEGAKPAQLTTQGDGCDPRAVKYSEYAFGDMLDEQSRSDVLLNAIAFVKKSF